MFISKFSEVQYKQWMNFKPQSKYTVSGLLYNPDYWVCDKILNKA